MPVHEWNYQVEEWNDQVPVEIIAGTVNLYVAKAAYKEAVKQRPDRIIYLRNGARVMERSDRDG